MMEDFLTLVWYFSTIVVVGYILCRVGDYLFGVIRSTWNNHSVEKDDVVHMNPTRDIVDSYDIHNYDIIDGVVHVVGDVNLRNKGLRHVPFRFGYVTGDFNISFNDLKSLKGAPEVVGGTFDCSYCNITSWEYITDEIGGKSIIEGNNVY
jgi:hypothetical protein